MITDIRKLKPGTLLQVNSQNIVAFYESTNITAKNKTNSYNLISGDVFLFLELLYLDLDFTVKKMNWVTCANMPNGKDMYFKALHKNNKIIIFVTSVDDTKNLPKDLFNNLFATYNFTQIV